MQRHGNPLLLQTMTIRVAQSLLLAVIHFCWSKSCRRHWRTGFSLPVSILCPPQISLWLSFHRSLRKYHHNRHEICGTIKFCFCSTCDLWTFELGVGAVFHSLVHVLIQSCQDICIKGSPHCWGPQIFAVLLLLYYSARYCKWQWIYQVPGLWGVSVRENVASEVPRGRQFNIFVSQIDHINWTTVWSLAHH